MELFASVHFDQQLKHTLVQRCSKWSLLHKREMWPATQAHVPLVTPKGTWPSSNTKAAVTAEVLWKERECLMLFGKPPL